MLPRFFYPSLHKFIRSANYSCGIAANNHALRYIFSNNAATSDDNIIVNCYTRHYFYEPPNTYIVLNCNRLKMRIKFG